jgi:hypothetical protein
LFGVSEQELRYALARARLGEAALELQPNPTIQGRQVYPGGAPFRMQAFTQDQIVGAGEDILRQRRAPPPLPSQANGAWEVQEAGRMSRSWAAAEQAQAQAIAQKQAEADKAHLEALERQVALATQVGAALGAGVYDVLAGIQSWRQAISQIVGQFARQGLSSLGASLFNSTARQLTGTTEPTGGPSYGSDL